MWDVSLAVVRGWKFENSATSYNWSFHRENKKYSIVGTFTLLLINLIRYRTYISNKLIAMPTILSWFDRVMYTHEC